MTVHPRGHGEHLLKAFSIFRANGSSPWARGTRFARIRQPTDGRFIPVGTGNTIGSFVRTGLHTVHPRGHGEHCWQLSNRIHYCGSSPWARGTPYHYDQPESIPRFIPVGTGNTVGDYQIAFAIAVHPRGHGEHVNHFKVVLQVFGSSPWARGTLQL